MLFFDTSESLKPVKGAWRARQREIRVALREALKLPPAKKTRALKKVCRMLDDYYPPHYCMQKFSGGWKRVKNERTRAHDEAEVKLERAVAHAVGKCPSCFSQGW